jgi:hypothetical protein
MFYLTSNSYRRAFLGFIVSKQDALFGPLRYEQRSQRYALAQRRWRQETIAEQIGRTQPGVNRNGTGGGGAIGLSKHTRTPKNGETFPMGRQAR